MREYKPGDDLRRIVWRASARTGKFLVREAEQGITDKITIILDTDRGSHSRDGEVLSESFEAGVRATRRSVCGTCVRATRSRSRQRRAVDAHATRRQHQLRILDAHAKFERAASRSSSRFVRFSATRNATHTSS